MNKSMESLVDAEPVTVTSVVEVTDTRADIPIDNPPEPIQAKSDAASKDHSGSEDEKEPSHKTDGDYVILMETNGKELESWYNCIRVEGNEAALAHLQSQLEKVDWYIVDDLSTFDLDLDHKICACTAKELTKIELNAVAFHRKFDGKLRKINLGFRRRDDNEAKICKAFDLLGYGQIDEYLSDEDLDPEDLTDATDDSQSSSSESDEEDLSPVQDRRKRTGRIPDALRMPIPRAARKKQGKKH